MTKSDANIKFAIILAVVQIHGKTTHLLCIYTLSKHAVNAAITIFASRPNMIQIQCLFLSKCVKT